MFHSDTSPRESLASALQRRANQAGTSARTSPTTVLCRLSIFCTHSLSPVLAAIPSLRSCPIPYLASTYAAEAMPTAAFKKRDVMVPEINQPRLTRRV